MQCNKSPHNTSVSAARFIRLVIHENSSIRSFYARPMALLEIPMRTGGTPRRHTCSDAPNEWGDRCTLYLAERSKRSNHAASCRPQFLSPKNLNITRMTSLTAHVGRASLQMQTVPVCGGIFGADKKGDRIYIQCARWCQP